MRRKIFFSLVLAFLCRVETVSCFAVGPTASVRRSSIFSVKDENSLTATASNENLSTTLPGDHRRILLQSAINIFAFSSIMFVRPAVMASVAAAPTMTPSSLDKLLEELKTAKRQMASIPDLIRKEQWDSVRAILIAPPLSDLWTKSARPTSLLKDFATAVGDDPAGDELAVLEAKEELLSHLRYLDMAAYNNVFNPIKTEGQTGATKELIRSYYDDPMNEYKASIKSLEELIELGSLE